MISDIMTELYVYIQAVIHGYVCTCPLTADTQVNESFLPVPGKIQWMSHVSPVYTVTWMIVTVWRRNSTTYSTSREKHKKLETNRKEKKQNKPKQNKKGAKI